MPSPFPGMDPYLEASGMWRRFPRRRCWRNARDLNERCRRVMRRRSRCMSGPDEAERRHRQATGRCSYDEDRSAVVAAGCDDAIAAPSGAILLPLPHRKRRSRISRSSTSGLAAVVTVIEVLEPVQQDKRGRSRTRTWRSGSEYLATSVNLVEIDLLRIGKRPPLGSRRRRTRDYYVLVCRRLGVPARGRLDRSRVRDPLPDVPVPLEPRTRTSRTRSASLPRSRLRRGPLRRRTRSTTRAA